LRRTVLTYKPNEMEKIMKALLEAKYPTLNADVLLDIANHTPNANIAIEKLCGLYVPHTEESLGKYRMNKDQVYTLIDINHWEESVTYSYKYEETTSCYISKDLDPSIILTVDNIKDYKVNSSDNAVWKTIKTGRILERQATESFNEWMHYVPYSDNF